MTRTQALAYLVQTLEEAVLEGNVPLHYLTGEEGNGSQGTRPDDFHLKKLAEAFKAVGCMDAYYRCVKEAAR